MNFSVVIISKNAEATIQKVVTAILDLSDDVIIVDSGSTDSTLSILNNFPVTVISTSWRGYGATKNIGNKAAKHAWILSLDADEVVDEQLKAFLKKMDWENSNLVGRIKRKNFIGDQWIKYGEWSHDSSLRFFNKSFACWDTAAVHEKLQFKDSPLVKNISGSMLHYTATTLEQYRIKVFAYARLSAVANSNNQAAAFKKYASPVVGFIKNYIFKLGFLDGRIGLRLALTNAKYRYLKYCIPEKQH